MRKSRSRGLAGLAWCLLALGVACGGGSDARDVPRSDSGARDTGPDTRRPDSGLPDAGSDTSVDAAPDSRDAARDHSNEADAPSEDAGTVPDRAVPDAPQSDGTVTDVASEDTGTDAVADGAPEDDGSVTDVANEDTGTDAVADGAPEDDGSVCGPTTSNGAGCADGVRRGLTNAGRHPDIAVCAGAWTGDVSNGIALCASGFHVCTGSESALRAVTYEEALCFGGCYAFDAAHDNYQCLPDCSSRIGTIDTETRLDMGGVGSGCLYKYGGGAGSCLVGGRIDASENDGIGCNYDARFSGVVCCRD